MRTYTILLSTEDDLRPQDWHAAISDEEGIVRGGVFSDETMERAVARVVGAVDRVERARKVRVAA